jgi:hypothetical protein
VQKRALLIPRTPPFRDGSQRASACQLLLGLVGAAERWTPTGPAQEARAAFDHTAGPDAQRMLAACWAIWEGSSTLGLNELLLLEPRRLEAVGELLAAMARGSTAIDAWLARWEPLGAPPRALLRPHPSVARRQRRGA